MKTILMIVAATTVLGLTVPASVGASEAVVEIYKGGHVAVCDATRAAFKELGLTIVEEDCGIQHGRFTVRNAAGMEMTVSNEQFKSWTYSTVRAASKEEARKIAAAISARR